MSDKEKAVYSRIGDVLGFDIIDYFKRFGMIELGDYVYSPTDKRRMLKMYSDLAKKYGIKFFNADNFLDEENMAAAVSAAVQSSYAITKSGEVADVQMFTVTVRQNTLRSSESALLISCARKQMKIELSPK